MQSEKNSLENFERSTTMDLLLNFHQLTLKAYCPEQNSQAIC